MANHYNEDGDLVVEDRTVFRQVGWLIYGGPNDGLMVKEMSKEHLSAPIGSFAPLYIEVGD